MEPPLAFTPPCNPALFQQIPINVRPRNRPAGIEEYPDELPESGRVVIPHGLRIAERLEDRVRLKNLPLEQAESG